MISTILLLPTAGDPHGLLRIGPFGARPPIVLLCCADESDPSRTSHTWHIARPPCREFARSQALVLFHDGAVIIEGRDHLRRRVIQSEIYGRTTMWNALADGVSDLQVVKKAASLLSCQVICLDMDGKEVRE